MTGTLKKVSQNKNALRTQEVSGEFHNLPKCGKSFVIWASPLTKETAVRLVTTSVVVEVRKVSDNEYEFDTLNSAYKLEATTENQGPY